MYIAITYLKYIVRRVMLKLATNKRLCPQLKDPFDECYCVKLSSQDIERAVYLCSNNYEICDIFKNCSNGSAKAKGSIHDRRKAVPLNI